MVVMSLVRKLSTYCGCFCFLSVALGQTCLMRHRVSVLPFTKLEHSILTKFSSSITINQQATAKFKAILVKSGIKFSLKAT